tara:strand:+ start:5269 stop:7263 length:1995 start_codon:yes stop_codon:yes gene_type:complete
MPGGIPYIIGNEAAERFSFYGMKSILVIFMTGYLYLLPGAVGPQMSNAEAIANYHLFTSAVYFTPILGALIADIFLGKYLTIISLSIVYCLGHGVLALMGLGEGINPAWMLFLGLGLISLGSGGIKPCVSAHVGDQFGKGNAHMLSNVYNWFYFSINVGAFLSTLMTPWFLEWYGPHYAFGIPGILMVIATFLFWCGRHKFIHVPPGGIKWFKETFSWVGISAILKLGIIYIFVAVFWALFDQTGSSWVLQAEDLNRNWLGLEWLPSQIQAVNPIMILVYIPVFTLVVYPLLGRVVKLTPLRKISAGLFIMVIGFAMVSMLQYWVDAGERPSIGWQIAAYAILTASEVMVSITCLEFSYTQAPRKMKSFIFALFLVSVSLGNIFTAGVNKVIQVPSSAEPAKMLAAQIAEGDGHGSDVLLDAHPHVAYRELPEQHFALELAGVDGVLGGQDDIRLGFAPDGTMTGFIGNEEQCIRDAIDGIGAYWVANGQRLPDNAKGEEIASSYKDPWGNPLRYTMVTGSQFQITSDGPDSVWQSQFDIRAEVTVNATETSDGTEEASTEGSSGWLSWAHPKESWKDRRVKELKLKAEAEETPAFVPESGNVDGFDRSIMWDVGGATTLSGAAYFWFFTWVMLGTAILFLPVVLFYKPKTYLQEEADAGAGDE